MHRPNVRRTHPLVENNNSGVSTRDTTLYVQVDFYQVKCVVRPWRTAAVLTALSNGKDGANNERPRLD